jgi:hypothetical protein
MTLDKDQTALYRKTMDQAKSQLDGVDTEMEIELEKTKAILVQLQESKKLLKQIYENAAVIVGVDAELKEEDAIEKTFSKTSLLEGVQ